MIRRQQRRLANTHDTQPLCQRLFPMAHNRQLGLAVDFVDQFVVLVEALHAGALQRGQAAEAVQRVIVVAAQDLH
ncbi:hypothetical protein BK652_12125 [Pseudomonas brassicacearum]|uniref:Uncharacterized protein n=2 Tax=Pseudomonas TaxID=286 RepID=A0A423GBN1_9PSED|nr:hypothetical protein RL74_25195 [Pseudomonas fluorescens]ROM83934.1 hypothetical protein BK652_12125 [Pseudomonas brassicacearum]